MFTLRAASSHRLHTLYVLALYLGLRRGELLGLRWEDVDLDSAQMPVVAPACRWLRTLPLRLPSTNVCPGTGGYPLARSPRMPVLLDISARSTRSYGA